MVHRQNQKRKQDGVSRHTRQVRARRRNSTESEEERESLDPNGPMRDSSLSSIGENAVSDSISRAESSRAIRGSWQSSQPESSIQEPIDTIVHIQPASVRDCLGAGHHPPQSANTPLPSTRNHQDEPNRQDESRTLLKRLQALESTIRNLSDEMRSYYQSFAQLLHWLEDVFRRIYPAAAHAASATKPPLGPLDTSSHRGGGGPKRDRALQKPFRDELRHRMGLQPRDPLPPFEESPPSLHSGPALRFDWSQRPDAYTELVESIIRELCSRKEAIASQIQVIGGQKAAIKVYMASLSRLFKQWRQQQKHSADSSRQEAREGRRRRRQRATKKSQARAALLVRTEALRRQYHDTDFTLLQAASAKVTDAEESRFETGQSETGKELTNRGLADSTRGGSNGGDGVGNGKGRRRHRGLRKIIPCWRSLELHRALQKVDKMIARELNSQPFPPIKLRTRLEPKRVEYPPLDAKLEPLPSSIKRWMVSAEFARLFKSAVKHVGLNHIAEGATGSITDPEQWGQHPPYEVYHSTHHGRQSSDISGELYLGESDRCHSDADDIHLSAREQGLERFSEPGTSKRPAPDHRGHLR